MAFPPSAPPLARALIERDYNDPTPVQTAVLQPEAADRDLLVSAQTGSGKTVAYGLALGATLLGEDAEFAGRAGAPLALIVAPTRELALQVERELGWLYQHARARIVSCVGGMDPRREARQLADGAHIVVGTPGRLRDHLERGRLDISQLKAVVLDEADEMLDLGFREDLEFILDATPEQRRTLLFSATLPRPIVAMAKQYQKDALRVEVAGGERGHADIEYRALRVANGEIELAVVNVLRFIDAPAALVFCNTREAVRHLQAILSERGFSVVALSGELSQNERNHALQALRDGRARVCVATDVAARGIDLPHLGLVIHADLPHDSEVLQHRSGRTGRAGRKGVSVLLIPFSRKRKADRIMVEARVQPVWSGPPTAEEIRALDQERLLHHPALAEEKTEDDLAMAQALLAERPPEDVAIALVRLYRAQLPAAEDLSDPAERGPRGRDRDAPPPRERDDRPRSPLARSEDAGERAADNPGRQPPRSRMDGNGVWFRIPLGRDKNADPRWILPMVCRQGGVTKQEIGAIRIFDRETRFEIAAHAAPAFIEAVRKTPKGEARIELVNDVTALPETAPMPAAPAAVVEHELVLKTDQAAEVPPRRERHRPASRQGDVQHDLVLKADQAPEAPPRRDRNRPSSRQGEVHHKLVLKADQAAEPPRRERTRPPAPAPESRHRLILKGDQAPEAPRRERVRLSAPEPTDAPPAARPGRKPFGKRAENKPFEKKVFGAKKKWQADAGDRPLVRPGSRPPHKAGKPFAGKPKKKRRD